MAKPENKLDKVNHIGDLLDRLEWDFSSCPDNRLYFCFTTEFAREIPEIIKQFYHDQEHNPKKFDEGYGQWHHIIFSDTGNKEGACLEVIDAPEGFPEKPYLSTFHHIDDTSYLPYDVGRKPLRPVVVKPNGGYQADDWKPDNLRPDQVEHFQIDWDFSDAAIVAAFAEWLKKVWDRPTPVKSVGHFCPASSIWKSVQPDYLREGLFRHPMSTSLSRRSGKSSSV